ncbi:galaxin-2-like isoform X2 [Octopus sinensis]|uniref:Galaxin-2-like isoform X2 n=1 Tax=Octopus sinensis TaxID=2607531 RepID=A0A7E6F133_9MOLL|nr:galaxin-2-like isoform X2 [Octopus sinensis]
MLIIAYGTVFGIEKRTRNIMSKILIFIALALLAVISSVTALHPPFVPHTTYYCNNQPFNIYSSICCSSQVTSITGFKRPACCGNVAFDRDASICCGGTVTAKSATVNGCCGATAIDLSLKDCCSGKVIDRLTKICCGATETARTSIYDVCCGTVKMDKTKNLCCGGVVKAIATTFPTGNNIVPSTYACCADAIFETRTHYCFYGQIYPRTNRVPWW